MNEYIYSNGDFESAMKEAFEDMFGHELVQFLAEAAIKKLERYVNVNRFFRRNCPGCVTSNDECDFAYGRNEAHGAWKKAVRGELFDCPVRYNGTSVFNNAEPEKGLQSIDISDRGEEPYPVVDVGDFAKE